jgi:hypothetical protein
MGIIGLGEVLGRLVRKLDRLFGQFLGDCANKRA